MKTTSNTCATRKPNCNPVDLMNAGRYLINVRKLALNAINGDINSRNEIMNYFRGLTYKNKTQAKKDITVTYLSSVNSSAKIVKGDKLNYDTTILYLTPANFSGFEVCAGRSLGCTKLCLNESGRVILDSKGNILLARYIKTLLFFANREYFCSWLFAEIETAKNKAQKNGREYSVRLNGTSDLTPLIFKANGVNILNQFPDVQFYDYTKLLNRFTKLSKYSNYYQTFSWSGENMEEVKQALKLGYNVAVPFMGKKLPETFLNVPVFNADETDLRFLDKQTGAIAGLLAKRVKDQKNKLADNNNFFVEL